MSSENRHDPHVLYRASIERMRGARRAREEEDFVLAMYLAGLAVECILQAVCHLDDPSHDARHHLPKWLNKCRTSLQDAINAPGVRGHWTTVVNVWRNQLRYLSEDALLGFLRRIKRDRLVSGGGEAIMKVNADRLLESADVVHRRGLAAWKRYTTK